MANTGGHRSGQQLDLALFYGICLWLAILGGSSRYDLVQIPILQIGLWAAVALAVVRMRGVPFAKGLLIAAVCYALWLGLQLIPLPHAVWTSLPGRQTLEAVELALSSHGDRPLSMTPYRTLNALGGFAAVLAPMLAAINLGRELPRHAIIAILLTGLASSIFAYAQMQAGTPYLYAVTNTGKPVGLFANSNHFAVYCAIVTLMLGVLALTGKTVLRPLFALGAAVVAVSVLLGPSRAGFAALLIALLAVALTWMALLKSRGMLSQRQVSIAVPIGVIALVLFGLAIFASADRIPALERLLAADTFEDLRFTILPTLLRMIGDYAPFGSGVGTFENVYRAFEDPAVMQNSYVNMAHNDVLQVFIENGVVAAAFLAVLVFLVIAYLRAALRHAEQPLVLAIGFLSTFFIIVLGSALDYPLRAPMFQAMTVLVLCTLACLGSGHCPLPVISGKKGDA